MEHQPGVADAYVLQFSKMVRENPAIFPGGVDMYKPHLHRVDTYRLVGEAHPGVSAQVTNDRGMGLKRDMYSFTFSNAIVSFGIAKEHSTTTGMGLPNKPIGVNTM